MNETGQLNDLAKKIHETVKSKGWHEKEHNVGCLIALAHSELSEALEEWRKGKPITGIYREAASYNTIGVAKVVGLNDEFPSNTKPCGFPVEIADCIIRLLDTCAYLGIDIDEAIKQKMAYNETREHRHGGKLA